MKTTFSSTTPPAQLKWMAVLLGFTAMRAFMGLQLPTLEMYGGVNPNAWFAPWISDTVLGLMAPYMIYLTLRGRGVMVWGALLAYNAIGAFDYVHGLMAQWTDPLVPDGIMGTPVLTYGSVGFSLVVQLTVIYLLLKPALVNYYGREDG